MEKKDIIEFFDRCAPSWDAEMIKSDRIIGIILDNAEVGAQMDILDVACGTGVMFPYYLDRGVASVVGIDIAPKMAEIAAEKFANDSQMQVVCGDVEEYDFGRKFDRIVVYNAFPHFPNPRKLISRLAFLLKEGGRLTIAHGMSRAAIDNHHSGAASKVSNGLMSADSLKGLFAPHLEVEIVIPYDRMYQVSGVKRTNTAKTKADTSMDEMLALMQFMVSHNDAHAQELAELADQLKEAGKTRAYKKLMSAVADFDVVNAQLSALQQELVDELIYTIPEMRQHSGNFVIC